MLSKNFFQITLIVTSLMVIGCGREYSAFDTERQKQESEASSETYVNGNIKVTKTTTSASVEGNRRRL